MSVTVTAVPIAFIATKIITATATAITAAAISASVNAAKQNEMEELLNRYEQSVQNNTTYKITQEDIKLLSQVYETPFMDNELLVRTLEEYGIKVIVNEENCITGEIERVKMNFVREDKSMPYKMSIKFPKDCDEMQEEIAQNLYEEYGSNTQEETYIKIKEKIENTNMYIEDEEILDDDSIVLTININD
ncbi:MAG: hypothetical protein K6C94_01625 [Candidatus Gastranaerophilales bacterium]|nr:hypothetical protein [Candidatus Gastranaerophilales bacterium]